MIYQIEGQKPHLKDELKFNFIKKQNITENSLNYT